MNNSYTTGLAFGICFALIAYVVIYKFQKEKLSGHYDERQELIRGRAYKYSLFTMIFLLLADLTARVLLRPIEHAAVPQLYKPVHSYVRPSRLCSLLH